MIPQTYQYHTRKDGYTYEFEAPRVEALKGLPAKQIKATRNGAEWYEFTVILTPEKWEEAIKKYKKPIDDGKLRVEDLASFYDEFLNIAGAVVVHDKLGLENPRLYPFEVNTQGLGKIKAYLHSDISGEVYAPSFVNYLDKRLVPSSHVTTGDVYAMADLFQGQRS